MKTLITLLILVSLSSIIYSKPDFKKIDSFDNNRYVNNEQIGFYKNQYFVLSNNDGSEILIFDSLFILKDSITRPQLINFLKNDLNLQEWDYITINNFTIDSYGHLWLATHKGIVIYDIEKKEIIKSFHYKNSVLPEKEIYNIFFPEKDKMVIYPNENAIYHYSDNVFTKVMFPKDTTNGEFTRLPNNPANAVLHRGKFYCLTGFSKNLAVYDGINFTLYDSGDYIVDKYQQHGHLLKCYNGSVYYFEIKNRLNLIKFTDGKFSVTDFIESDIFKIPDNCFLYYYDFEFDNIGNLWLSFQTNDTITNNIEQYLLRYNSVTDFELYKIEDLISGFDDGAYRISIIPETNEIFLSTNYSVYKSNLGTTVDSDTEIIPNLFIRSLYPNPAKDKIILNFATLPSLYSNLKVKLYNYLGVDMNIPNSDIRYNQDSGFGTMEVNVTGLRPGLYLIVLDNGDYIRSKNIIIQE